MAQANLEHKRDDAKKALQLLLRNTSALEQVWYFVCTGFNCHLCFLIVLYHFIPLTYLSFSYTEMVNQDHFQGEFV